MTLVLGFAAATIASVAFSVGVVLQTPDARKAKAREQLRLSLVVDLARRRRWVVGSLLICVGFGFQVLALAWAPFVVVQPVIAAGLLLVLFLAVRILGEKVGAGEIAGVLGVAAGIGLLAWGMPTGIESVSSEFAVITVVGVLGVGAMGPFALRGRGRLDSATVVIVASGLASAAGSITTKMVSVSLGDALWLPALIWLVATGAVTMIALITEMTALQRRQASLVVPLNLAGQTFLPVLLGPIYLHARWETGALGGVPLAMGMLLVLLGSVTLARGRAVSALAAA
jgi:drug/metabolite transporter (DMT)-like permease